MAVAPGGGEDRTVARSNEATEPRTRQSRGTKHTADNFGSLAGKHIKASLGRIRKACSHLNEKQIFPWGFNIFF